MDLVWFAEYLNKVLKESCSQSFHKWNHSKEVIYPFLTYEFDYQSVDEMRDEFEITLSLFDSSISNKNLLELETKLVNNLDRRYEFLDKANVYIRSGRAQDINTGFESLQRRNLDIVMKVDWKINE